MCGNDTDIDTSDSTTYVLDIIRKYFPIIQGMGIFIELIFFFVMIRNWCMKSTFLMSAFFYLLTLKTLNDMFYIVYTVMITYWGEQTKYFYLDTGTPFFITSLEIDVFSQFAIAVNRYTAMMMPLKQERVSFTISSNLGHRLTALVLDLVTYCNLCRTSYYCATTNAINVFRDSIIWYWNTCYLLVLQWLQTAFDNLFSDHHIYPSC